MKYSNPMLSFRLYNDNYLWPLKRTACIVVAVDDYAIEWQV